MGANRRQRKRTVAVNSSDPFVFFFVFLVEHLIGTLRRDCLDHVVVLNGRHLKRILTDYFAYYHSARPHQALDKNSPLPRQVERPQQGPVIAQPMVGGLHHCYFRAA
jgi:putative transposase